MTVTGLGRSGPYEWLLQRISAVVILAYVVFIGFYAFFNDLSQFTVWYNLFQNPAMKIFSILALISIIAHAWVGIWTVTTDYINHGLLRLLTQLAVILALIIYLVWGLQIVYGSNPMGSI